MSTIDVTDQDFQGGEKVATSIGAKPKQVLETEFAEYLK